jgi:hypothetical protein
MNWLPPGDGHGRGSHRDGGEKVEDRSVKSHWSPQLRVRSSEFRVDYIIIDKTCIQPQEKTISWNMSGLNEVNYLFSGQKDCISLRKNSGLP